MSSSEILDHIGASAIGVAPYRVLEEHRIYLNRWLDEGYEGELGYMREHRREDPAIIFPDCQSVIVVLFSPQRWTYHSPIRKRLKRLLALLQTFDSGITGRGVVDTAPLLERAWGVEAHLGWVGRNSMLIHPRLGSNFNIGVLLVNRTVEQLSSIENGTILARLREGSFSQRVEDGCTKCNALCIKGCPGGAILENRTIDCRVCHSYLSQRIEPRPTPDKLGCTICQKLCPYNK